MLTGRGRLKIADSAKIDTLKTWLDELGVKGYQGRPFDMIEEARNRK